MKVVQLPQQIFPGQVQVYPTSKSCWGYYLPQVQCSSRNSNSIWSVNNDPKIYISVPRSLPHDVDVGVDDSSAQQVTETPQAPSVVIQRRAAQISPDLKGTCVFLVGMNCSIKSNLGKLLANSLRYYYFDSDTLVEEAVGGKAAATSFVQRDLKGFRDSETEVLKQLSSIGRLVVCAGNGVVQCAANLGLLRHGISIWIDVPLDMVAKEVLEDRFQLPAAETITGSYSEVLTHLSELYEQSQSGYATADATIALQNVASRLGYDTLDAVTPEDMVLEILKEIERLMRVKKLMEEAARPF